MQITVVTKRKFSPKNSVLNCFEKFYSVVMFWVIAATVDGNHVQKMMWRTNYCGDMHLSVSTRTMSRMSVLLKIPAECG